MSWGIFAIVVWLFAAFIFMLENNMPWANFCAVIAILLIFFTLFSDEEYEED